MYQASNPRRRKRHNSRLETAPARPRLLDSKNLGEKKWQQAQFKSQSRIAHRMAQARKHCCRKKKSSSVCAMTEQQRANSLGKVEKKYIFDGPNGKESLAVSSPAAANCSVYHFMPRPGLGSRLRKAVLCLAIIFGRRHSALERSRRHFPRDFACPSFADSVIPETHGLEIQVGFFEWNRL